MAQPQGPEANPEQPVDPVGHAINNLGIPQEVIDSIIPPQDSAVPQRVMLVGLSEPIPGITFVANDGAEKHFSSTFDGLIIAMFAIPGFRTFSVILFSSSPTLLGQHKDEFVYEAPQIFAYADDTSNSRGAALLTRQTRSDGSLIDYTEIDLDYAEDHDGPPYLEYDATSSGMSDFDTQIGSVLKQALSGQEFELGIVTKGRPEDI